MLLYHTNRHPNNLISPATSKYRCMLKKVTAKLLNKWKKLYITVFYDPMERSYI